MDEKKNFYFLVLLLFILNISWSQTNNYWHNEKRQIHYSPEDDHYVLRNGRERFNRPLYVANSSFRIEAGDLPEFAMYLPGMGGVFRLGVIVGDKSKWGTEFDSINTKYYPEGRIVYEIRDNMLEGGELRLKILTAPKSRHGYIVQLIPEGLPDNVKIAWLYGGASGDKFSRNGDINREHVFSLKPEYAYKNEFDYTDTAFTLNFQWDKGEWRNKRSLRASFPLSKISVQESKKLNSPSSLLSDKRNGEDIEYPVLAGELKKFENKKAIYWLFEDTKNLDDKTQKSIAELFQQRENELDSEASEVIINTPNSFINNLGTSLYTAAKAIWEPPAFVHGAVAWRMHLNGWRGAYVANTIGKHNWAKSHFSSYANSQVLSPKTGPFVSDSSLYLARQREKMGTSMFSRGYISRNPNNSTRPHHYDMNLVFIDQLLTYFKWTGDFEFLKEMWPVIKRHLNWEKRNFDGDGDGLYEGYAQIWASDALQYSGGGVAYTSAYNYRANKIASELAVLMKDDPDPYREEAKKIEEAVRDKLWVKNKGVYAEYKDILGEKLLHDSPGIWTIYHIIDKMTKDPFRFYQLIEYVKSSIPRIPIQVDGLKKENLGIFSTTNWQPYTWSVNNVSLAENLNTALAFWQGGDNENAFKLWESALIESMYLGASPGGFHQLSFYDAMRGELYRDFADPIGVAGRSLVEGLFGIRPNAIRDTLTIDPGFPKGWDHASIETSDIKFSMEKKLEDRKVVYHISPHFPTQMNLKFMVKVPYSDIDHVLLNGEKAEYKIIEDYQIGGPTLVITDSVKGKYDIEIKWKGKVLNKIDDKYAVVDSPFELDFPDMELLGAKDPMGIFKDFKKEKDRLEGALTRVTGQKYLFLKVRQGHMTWWEPMKMNIQPKVNLSRDESRGLIIKNNTKGLISGDVLINGLSKSAKEVKVKPNDSIRLVIEENFLMAGTNVISFNSGQNAYDISYKIWDKTNLNKDSYDRWESIDLTADYNAKLEHIFDEQYFTPRSSFSSLQLPTTGVGNWTYPKVADNININLSGIRKNRGDDGLFWTSYGFPFSFSFEKGENNVIFTSQWDTFPTEVAIPLSGNASHAYLALVGTTNPMQSQITNGVVIFEYVDGSIDKLELRNPNNWWPIEQDYYQDKYAFKIDAIAPPRIYLKSGDVSRDYNDYISIAGFTEFGIDGGAATILDLPLNEDKQLKKMYLKSIANDVVIGLMGLTLKR